MTDWAEAFPHGEQEIYRLAGFGHESGLGDRPALIVIDVQYRTLGDYPVPIRHAIETMYPTACGAAGWEAVNHIQTLIAEARRADVPVIFPCVAPKNNSNAGRFGAINPAVASIPKKGYEFPEEASPHEGDLVIPKRHASAFFGTPLVSFLIDSNIDTVVLTGCTTSGCVRASAVDSFSFNFRTVVVSDAVYDRSETSHKVSLFEMDQKYADVLDTPKVLAYLRDKGGALDSEAV